MAFVVTDSCRDCMFTDCVPVCPVECFWADDRMIYIDPTVCIDCSACLPVCPVQAIYVEANLPDEKKHFTELNREKCASGTLVNLTEKRDPLPGAAAKRASLGL